MTLRTRSSRAGRYPACTSRMSPSAGSRSSSQAVASVRVHRARAPFRVVSTRQTPVPGAGFHASDSTSVRHGPSVIPQLVQRAVHVPGSELELDRSVAEGAGHRGRLSPGGYDASGAGSAGARSSSRRPTAARRSGASARARDPRVTSPICVDASAGACDLERARTRGSRPTPSGTATSDAVVREREPDAKAAGSGVITADVASRISQCTGSRHARSVSLTRKTGSVTSPGSYTSGRSARSTSTGRDASRHAAYVRLGARSMSTRPPPA